MKNGGRIEKKMKGCGWRIKEYRGKEGEREDNEGTLKGNGGDGARGK